MAKIKISDGLSLPIEIAGRRTAIFGISGSGKSNSATVITEQLIERGEQVVLIDPKGEAWGLLSLASGKPSNLPVIIFGEPNGHIETLAESHGPRLADFVVDSGQSVALSLLGFESDQSERRFVATFLRQLYRRKTRMPNPSRTLVIFEEAHLFVPEAVRGEAAELAGAVQRIVRQGRSFGIGTLLIDQRPQDVSKRCITQCDTLVCHQLVHKLDRDALREWVRGYDVEGSGEKFLESLASLDPGEAWVWSPAWLKLFERVKVHRRTTFDSGAAPDGSAAARKVHRAEVDIDALRGQLAEIVEKAKADDPRELRKQIKELRNQLEDARVAQPTATPAAKENRVEVPVLKPVDFQRAERFVSRLETGAAKILEMAQRVELLQTAKAMGDEAERLRAALARVGAARGAKTEAPTRREPQELPRHHEFTPRVRRQCDENGTGGDRDPLNGTMGRALMTVLAERKDRALTKPQILTWADYASSGPTSKAFAEMVRRGYVESLDRSRLQINRAGLDWLGQYTPLPVGRDLRDKVLREANQMERSILTVIFNAHPEPIAKPDILQQARYASSGPTSKAFAKFVRLGYAVPTGRSMLVAGDELFE